MAVSGFNTPSWRTGTPVQGVDYSFTGAPFTRVYNGLLFDMDGTIIDSTNAVVKHWEEIGQLYGIDPKVILATSHGRRSIDVFQQIDPARANWEYICDLEAQLPGKYGSDAVELGGARSLLASLDAAHAPWAIVTSGTRGLVSGWLSILKLTPPSNLVTAEDVKDGKPDPACYALGRQRLGLDASAKTLVFEDAPAGIRAGKAAGCDVLAVATTHAVEQLKEAGADWVVRDLSSVRLVRNDPEKGVLEVEIRETLR